MILVGLARLTDVLPLLELAVELDALFGTDSSTPGFRVWLERSIAEGTMFCARIDGGVVAGLQFSNERINWLGVRGAARGHGVGEALVRYAIGPECASASVVTFGVDHPHPDAARTRDFYVRLGFQPTGETRPAVSDGTPREVFVWSR